MNVRILLVAVMCAAAPLSGCATKSVTIDAHAGDGLRNSDLDVLFATEFPVASEAEAISRAAKALSQGEVDKALFFYVRALQFNPENVDLIGHIGDIHMRRNNVVMAKRAYQEALRVDETHTRSLESMGLINMAEGNDEEAIAHLTRAMTNDDARWRAHNALGIYLDRRGDFDGAQRHYDSALTHNPDAGHVLNNRGYSKFLAGDVSGAMRDLFEAAKDRGFERAWGNLGMVYASQGLYDEALSAYLEIMSDTNAYNNAGQIALENGDLAAAKRFLNEAIHRSPTYFPAAEKNIKLLEKQWQARDE